jgi:cupin fold WbuC family metalloprotein
MGSAAGEAVLSAPLKVVTHSLLDELAGKAAGSSKRRTHYNLHSGPDDLLQRFLVVARGDSYFHPHRHATRGELATLVRGRVDVLTFDDTGTVLGRMTVGEGSEALAYETPPRTWHTLVPRSEVCAFLEVKLGPYDPATAAEFAPWAPAEVGSNSWSFRAWLATAGVGDCWRAATASVLR